MSKQPYVFVLSATAAVCKKLLHHLLWRLVDYAPEMRFIVQQSRNKKLDANKDSLTLNIRSNSVASIVIVQSKHHQSMNQIKFPLPIQELNSKHQ